MMSVRWGAEQRQRTGNKTYSVAKMLKSKSKDRFDYDFGSFFHHRINGLFSCDSYRVSIMLECANQSDHHPRNSLWKEKNADECG